MMHDANPWLATTATAASRGRSQHGGVGMLSTRHRVVPTLHPHNHDFRTRYSLANEARPVLVGKLQTTGLTMWEAVEEWVHQNANPDGVKRGSRWIVEKARVPCNFMIVLVSIVKTTVSWQGKIPRFEGYLLGFYFWLDLLAAMSMLLYIPRVAQDMGVSDPDEFAAGTDVSFLRRTGRAIRLARLFGYMKNLHARREKAQRQQEMLRLSEEAVEGSIDEDEAIEKMKKLKPRKQSRIGVLLTEGIVRKVILIVLILFSFAPQLVYSENNAIEQAAARSLHKYTSPGNELAFNVTYSEMLEELGTFSSGAARLLYVRADPTHGVLLDKRDARRRLRMSEREVFEFSTTRADSVTYRTKVVFSKRPQVEHEAVLGICLTFAVAIVLLGSASSFTREAQHFVLNPIERMMALVEQVVENPAAPINHSSSKSSKASHSEFETNLLETTIKKVTDLLRVSYGEAGAGIISQNLRLTEVGGAVINPLVAGKRVYAIFAFTDIRDFDEAIKRNEGQTMRFVNTVAEIVHRTAEIWAGQSNKNLGNAFLMVWRIGDDRDIFAVTHKASVARKRSASASSFREMWEMGNGMKQNIAPKSAPELARSDSVELPRVPGVDALADMALIAFLKIQIELHRWNTSTRRHGILQGFTVRMGVGMHAGWAIEGAVGSMQKVDATYLSPHVNMAARMQTATKQYNVSILMTQDFFALMSRNAREVCRKIDKVTVKGSKHPKKIYTYDCNPAAVKTNRGGKGPEAYTREIWTTDPDLVSLRSHAAEPFAKTFAQAMNQYLDGRWDAAKENFEQAKGQYLELNKQNPSKEDGPTETIYRFMESMGFKRPENWKGVRELTSK